MQRFSEQIVDIPVPHTRRLHGGSLPRQRTVEQAVDIPVPFGYGRPLHGFLPGSNSVSIARASCGAYCTRAVGDPSASSCGGVFISHQLQLYSHRPSLWLSTAHPCRQSSNRGVLFTHTFGVRIASASGGEHCTRASSVSCSTTSRTSSNSSTWSCEFNSSTWSSCPWWRWSGLCPTE